MDAQVEQLDGQRVRLTVEVPADEVKHAVAHAVHDLGDRVKVPGFRAGKVPPQVLMARIGTERLFGEAVDSHIGSWFWTAARLTRVRPSERPDFSYELPTTDEQDWAFTAEFPVQGPVEPADWHELEVPRVEVEVGDELVTAGLEALQQTTAALSSVEGRGARLGDVAVVDILSDGGQGQRDYIVELGSDRLLPEIEEGIRDLLPGESEAVSWEGAGSATRQGTVTLKEVYEKVLPPLDDELALTASEFTTLEELRADIAQRIRTQLEEEAESRFRSDAVDELVKASHAAPAELVVEMRTREVFNAFLNQLQARGIDPDVYLRMTGITGAELTASLRDEATRSIGRELVLEGVADRLGIEITDDDIREELREGGEDDEEVEEVLGSSFAERLRYDLRLRRAVDRIAAEVKPISAELAEARERIWTPEKGAAASGEKKLWTPGSAEEGVVR